LDLLEKKTYGYKERDEAARLKFQEEIKEIDKDNLVFLNEAGVQES
jgi:hypothetical protein